MEVQQQFGDEVTIIGVPGLAGMGSMQEFVSETGVDVIPHLPDASGSLWERFDVREHRTYVFIDDDGSMRTSGYGRLGADVEELIAS